jgi:thermostable 8-oxoguanine DNA glycosylase
MGLVAFHRVRDRGLLDGRTSANTLEASLREPFMVGGRNVRYRFAQQKAAYLAGAMRAVDELEQPADDVGFRDALAKLPGVGLKTASWITRNVRESDAVAILDIHVCRACALAGLFPQTANVATGYRKLERRYLAFAGAIGVKASVLDSLMWATMRRLSPWVRRFKPATSE